jgi:hypothetical protein
LTSIGLFFQLNIDEGGCDNMIQASSRQVPFPIKAEAVALLLAKNVANLLHLQQVTFLADNLSFGKSSSKYRHKIR